MSVVFMVYSTRPY